LDFQLGHAMARDAVHQSFEIAPLQVAIEGLGHESIVVQTRAADRATYLRRPDLGRRLDDESRAKLAAASAPCDLSITLTDGLSALAIHRQALPLLEQLLPRLAKENW